MSSETRLCTVLDQWREISNSMTESEREDLTSMMESILSQWKECKPEAKRTFFAPTEGKKEKKLEEHEYDMNADVPAIPGKPTNPSLDNYPTYPPSGEITYTW